MYEVRFAESVEGELAAIRTRDRKILLDAIEHQLRHEPGGSTRNRKVLEKLVPPFEAVPPVWELRVGEYRVFYDVEPAGKTVYVRAVRKKPRHKTTEDIL